MLVAVNGACGRMGQRIVQLIVQDSALGLGAAIESPSHQFLGQDAGEIAGVGPLGVPVTAELPVGHRLSVVIDFSAPEGTMSILSACMERRIPLLVASTGHTRAQRSEIESAAHQTALLITSNTSVGVNVLRALVRLAAERLRDRDFDVEILERHHRSKKDSPSGTALALAELVQGEMGQTELVHGRQGTVGERRSGAIGVHAIRAGDNVGEHTVIFSTEGETIELTHRAHSRDCYARGALQAAKFLADRPAGRYTMDDVLGM
jgi:4-hydroxy-tetrahydrodipicolinate reductase